MSDIQLGSSWGEVRIFGRGFAKRRVRENPPNPPPPPPVTGLLQQAICLHPSDAPVLVNVSVEPSQSVGLQENTLMNSSFELPSYTTFRSVVVSTLSKLQGVGFIR